MPKSRIAVVPLVAAILLGGCASTSHETGGHTPTATATAVFDAANAADIEFVQMMLPHHEQAIEIAALATDRATDPRILDLTADIAGAQQAEVDDMYAMLAAWEVPALSEHSGHAMPGMVSDADMAALAAASGPEFDRLFLDHMIAHHEGAIDMAETVIANGRDPQVLALAEAVITAQQAEITHMQDMRAGS